MIFLGKGKIFTAGRIDAACRRLTSSICIKPTVLVVGSGWAGYRVAHDIDKSKFVVKLVSPRNHFLFTPLLPSTAVGTLEFRAIQEPVRTIPGLNYYQAEVDKIDFENAKVHCNDSFKNGHDFTLSYDALVIATGCETNTFGVEGVYNNDKVFFLKQLSHARAIRNRLIECFERASSPGVDVNEMKKLLTFVIVGGGPTNVEFAAELHDFLKADVSRWYPDIYMHAQVMIVEASGHILGTFNTGLVAYVESLFKTRRFVLKLATSVKWIAHDIAGLSDGTEVPFGLLIWSTGIKQVSVIDKLGCNEVAKLPNGRLHVDSHLRVMRLATTADNEESLVKAASDVLVAKEQNRIAVGNGRVFALGDCAAVAIKPLPALAQVAGQQGSYLAKQLNEKGIDFASMKSKPFQYQHLLSMAQCGEWKGVIDTSNIGSDPSLHSSTNFIPPVKGITAFLLWRAAYWTKQVSLQNKMLIPMYWFKSMVFGRDISRF